MKKTYLLLLALSISNAYAVAPAPSLDGAAGSSSIGTYSPYPGVAAATPSVSVLDNVAKLQAQVTQLTKRLDYVEQNLRLGQVTPAPAGTTIGSNGYLPGEKSRYDYAYTLFKNGAYDQAISEFQAIISTYPNGEYADNSQYWTGESLLKKGDKQGGMRAFDRVVYAYPRSAKVPDALLKIGITQFELGNRTKAKEYYDYLIATYPGTTAATAAYDKKTKNGLY
jgi:tol-pal system protein YbgF